MVGQHIRAMRDGRWNHAIDCGDETVIHLSDGEPQARIQRSYRPEFVAGAEAVEVVTHRERTFAPREVVRRAYSRFADPALAAMFRDSEAFAAWCETGRLPPATPNVAVSVPGVEAKAAPAARKAKPGATPRPAPKAKARTKARVAAKPRGRAKKAKASARRPAKPAARKAPAPKRGPKAKRRR